MKTKKLTTQEKSIFCNEIAIILSSGLSIYEGLDIIYPELPNTHLKEVAKQLLDYYQEHGKFYDAIKASESFDTYMEEMVQIGEESGNLDSVMHQLSKYYERNDDMQAQIKDAITYPMILMIMMLIVIGILVLKILPIFQNVLSSLGASLSPFAQTLMQFGETFAFSSFLILVIVAIVLVAFYIYTKVSSNKRIQVEFLSGFLNIIEPTIVAVLSFVVGIILLSVMLPLMSIMSSLG